MVNVDKHRNRKKTKVPVEKFVEIEDLVEAEKVLLGFIITNTDGVLKELKIAKRKYNRIIKKLISDRGAFIGFESCSSIMEEMFRTDFTLETVKLYYYAITIPSKKLEELLASLEENFKLLQKIKRLQNRSLDNANYFGLGSAVITEVFSGKANNISDYTSAEEYENLLRLNIPYKEENSYFTEKSSISL